MSATFTIGKSIDTNLPVHIKNAENGLKCRCVCYECNERLQAVQGQSENARAWHYRHDNTNSNCPGNNETALHQFAKLILFENNVIDTPKKKVNYIEPSLETVIDKYRSDVSAKYNDTALHFEVVVHHDLKPDKKLYYQSNKVNCIKIDLTNSEFLTAQPEQIRHAVIKDKTNKHFIQWNEDKVNADVSTSSDSNSWLVAIGIFLGSLLLFRKSLFGSSNKRRKYRR